MPIKDVASAAGRQALAERAAAVPAAPPAAAPTGLVRIAAAATRLPSQPETRGTIFGAAEAAVRAAGRAQCSPPVRVAIFLCYAWRFCSEQHLVFSLELHCCQSTARWAHRCGFAPVASHAGWGKYAGWASHRRCCWCARTLNLSPVCWAACVVTGWVSKGLSNAV